jgi:hypothetical protein
MEIILNLWENIKPYANTKLDEPLTSEEMDMLRHYQNNRYPYCSPDIWRALIAKGLIELRGYNEIWLTKIGGKYILPLQQGEK